MKTLRSTIIAATIVVAGITSPVLASAAPIDSGSASGSAEYAKEKAFVDDLRANGVAVVPGQESNAVKAGRMACQALDQGTSKRFLANELASYVSLYEAEVLVGLSVKHFCPWH